MLRNASINQDEEGGSCIRKYGRRATTTSSSAIRLRGHCSHVVDSKFSTDGAILCTASWDTRVIIWECFNWTKKRCLCHEVPIPQYFYNKRVVSLDLESKCNRFLSCVTDDSKLRIWDLWKTLSGVDDTDATTARVDDTEPALVIELLAAGGECGAGIPQRCVFNSTGTALLVSCSNKIMTFETSVSFPSLQHLCRMAAWKTMSREKLIGHTASLPNRLKRMVFYQC